MKKNKKAMIASLVLVGAVCVGSTLAYLSDQSNTLTNSFTVGQGYVPDESLDEAVWVDEHDYDGDADPKNYTTSDNELRTLNGNNYGSEESPLSAGESVTKDPKIRLTKESITSWVYMSVTYKKDQAYSFVKGDKINKDLNEVVDTTLWKKISKEETNGEITYVYRWHLRLNEDASDTIQSTDALFDKIKLDNNADNTSSVEDITIKACAVQAMIKDSGKTILLAANDDNEAEAALKADAPKFD